MPLREIVVTDIGAVARRLLDSIPEASVMGATSRGAFLHLSTGWVLFLSPESFRGPLTLNAPSAEGELNRLEGGLTVKITPSQISIPELGVILQHARLWEAHPPARPEAPPAERASNLRQVARYALDMGKTGPVSQLLPHLLGFVDPSDVSENPIYARLMRLAQLLKAYNHKGIVAELDALLGLGSGLTPSGDDLILGFLFTLKRWGHVLAPRFDPAALAHSLLPLAHRKTTTLSANLIECALDGQANERLLLALDGILTGEPDPVTCAGYLAGWGNTSGLDALVGMALAQMGS